MSYALLGDSSGGVERHGSRILLFSQDQIAPCLDVARSVPGAAQISTSVGIGRDIQRYIETVIEEKKMYVRALASELTIVGEAEKEGF